MSRFFVLALLMAAATASANPDDARQQQGLQLLRQLNAGQPQPVLEAMRADFPFLADATAGYALGEVWSRPGLDVRTRQLAACAAFAALGQLAFFKVHAGYALNAGVTPEELKEIVYLTTVPAGFPRAIEASQALRELLRERAGQEAARSSARP